MESTNNDALQQQAAGDEGASATSEFQAVKSRLEEIANAVDDQGISLDEALDLYEEAVSLGLRASDLLEVGIAAEEESQVASSLDEGAGTAQGQPIAIGEKAKEGTAAVPLD